MPSAGAGPNITLYAGGTGVHTSSSTRVSRWYRKWSAAEVVGTCVAVVGVGVGLTVGIINIALKKGGEKVVREGESEPLAVSVH